MARGTGPAGSTVALVNPTAGGGRAGREVGALVAALRAQGLELAVETTDGPGEATARARAARRRGVGTVIAVGGDGTAWEVVNGLLGEDEAPTCPRLAILPLGTGNSFLRDFGHEGIESAIAAVVRGTARRCDVVRLEHRGGSLYSLNLVCLGFAARVGALRNRRFARWGLLGYPLAVVSAVATLRPEPIPTAVDGIRDDRPATFVALCNSRYTGGAMLMAPGAEVDDGLVDRVRVGALGRLELLRTFPRLFRGTHVDHPAVEVDRAAEVEVGTAGPVEVLVDGEVLTLEPIRVVVEAGAIEVVA